MTPRQYEYPDHVALTEMLRDWPDEYDPTPGIYDDHGEEEAERLHDLGYDE